MPDRTPLLKGLLVNNAHDSAFIQECSRDQELSIALALLDPLRRNVLLTKPNVCKKYIAVCSLVLAQRLCTHPHAGEDTVGHIAARRVTEPRMQNVRCGSVPRSMKQSDPGF
jgi:hypothetical protein